MEFSYPTEIFKKNKRNKKRSEQIFIFHACLLLFDVPLGRKSIKVLNFHILCLIHQKNEKFSFYYVTKTGCVYGCCLRMFIQCNFCRCRQFLYTHSNVFRQLYMKIQKPTTQNHKIALKRFHCYTHKLLTRAWLRKVFHVCNIECDYI